jgi:Flp pilus assembly protein TadD
MDRQDLAIQHLRAALRVRPDHIAALGNLGTVLNSLYRFDEAESAYRNALVLRPESAEINLYYGRFLRGRDRHEEAVAAYRKAVELAPEDAVALSELGLAVTNLGDDREAEALLDRARAMAPDDLWVLNNVGLAHLNMRRFRDAEALFVRGHEQAPDNVVMLTNLGNVRFYQGLGRDGVPALRRAIERDPDNVETHVNLAHALLGDGRLDEGWREYEWRLKKPEVHVPYDGPIWDGSDLAGKTILVWREQGVADEVLFSSCCPDVIARAGRVLIECDYRLAPIYERSFAGAAIHGLSREEHIGGRREDARYDWNKQFEPIDCYIAPGSLARYLRPTIESFPDRAQGWLKPDPERGAAWRRRLAALGPGPKVGICWRSSVMNPQRAHTVSPLSDWGPLLTVPGVRPCPASPSSTCSTTIAGKSCARPRRAGAWRSTTSRTSTSSMTSMRPSP